MSAQPPNPEEDAGPSASPDVIPSGSHLPDAEQEETSPLPSTEDLQAAIRKIVTEESVETLTRRILRQKLEEQFDLPENSLVAQKAEINAYLATVLAEMAPPPPAKRRRTGGGSDDEEEETTGGKGGVVKKQSGLMTRAYFLEHAEAHESNVGPIKFTMTPREFSTGSCGWFYSAKREMPVGDKMVTCQLTFNCAVLGSKNWKDGEAKTED